MIIETFTALGAISLGASLGVYLVASEASLPSFRRPAQRLAWWARDTDDAATVSGGIPWRFVAPGHVRELDGGTRADVGGAQIEAFCALCEEALEGVGTSVRSVDEGVVSPRCARCDVRYPLTEGMLLHEVIEIARRALMASRTEGSSAPDDSVPGDSSPGDVAPVGRFAER